MGLHVIWYDIMFMESMWKMCGIGRSLTMYYRPFSVRRMMDFYGQFIAPGDLCFDIGAHVGNRIRAWSLLGAHVIGVEPQPHIMRFLRLVYRRSSNVILLEKALGAASGMETMHVSHLFPTVSTLSDTWTEVITAHPKGKRVQWETNVSVSVTTLDDLIAEYGKPAFCKIDVEGYDLNVLKGLSQPLRALSFEYFPSVAQDAADCIDFLTQLGRFKFNWSATETMRMISPTWMSAEDMKAQLKTLRPDGASGDIYVLHLE